MLKCTKCGSTRVVMYEEHTSNIAYFMHGGSLTGAETSELWPTGRGWAECSECEKQWRVRKETIAKILLLADELAKE